MNILTRLDPNEIELIDKASKRECRSRNSFCKFASLERARKVLGVSNE